MAEYLIQGETLTATADKIRTYVTGLGNSTHILDSSVIASGNILKENAIIIYYWESIDPDRDFWAAADYSDIGIITEYNYLQNDKNQIVPVIFTEEIISEQDEGYFYVGTDVINGKTYDKWRKIETARYGEEDNLYLWNNSYKKYIYTNRVVVNNSTSGGLISPNDFPEKIEEVYNKGVEDSTGGTDTSDATATAADILSGKTAYISTGKVTGTIAFQNAQTITPGTSNITAISKGYYANGSVIVSGSANLTAANIKSGVNIFGVVGNYTPTATSDYTREDAIVDGTFSGAYVNTRVDYIGSYKFYNVPITSAIFTNVTTMGTGAFSACYSLRAISFPACTTIPMSAFAGCSKLMIVYAPACRTVAQMAFYQCSGLSVIELPACTKISANAFAGCTALSDITIGTSNCALANSTAFANTKITSSTGTIRVPSAYVSAYKSSVNWSYFSNRIYTS